MTQDKQDQQNEKVAGEASYLDTLVKASTEPGAFSGLPEDSDSSHIKSIQKRINKIVNQEIALIEWKDAVNKEALA